MDPTLDTQRRLLYILERALTELSLLSLNSNSEQAYALTQAVENIPRHLLVWQEASLGEITQHLQDYKTRYPSSFDYLPVLDPKYCNSEDLLE